MRGSTKAWIAGAAVLLAAAAGYAWLGAGAGDAPIRASVAVTDVLRDGDTTGYARATEPRPFSFPADHGPHPSYRNEWWYFTGNLETDAGRHFGVQLTFFRTALSPRPADRASGWSTNQAYMAHFAVSDVAAGRFYRFERMSRGALGLAGARARPVRVWLEDWTADGSETGLFPLRLRAAEGGVAVDLRVRRGKPVVLQGEDGLSRKGPEPGNASYYYSHTRLPTSGTIRVDGESHTVRGTMWLDREWGTSALGADLEGWDWFALQLSDGSELMVYRLRRDDGAVDPHSSGVFVSPDGASRTLAAGDVRIRVRDRWTSPRGDASYPARWRIRVPAEGIDLTVEPYLEDQEMDVSVRYWEGAVRVRGTRAERSIRGDGYVELTGYAGTADGRR